MPTQLATAPVTSRWYGQGGAVEVARRLESLAALTPCPGPVGVITARDDALTVTFVAGLTAPLPPPWQPCGRATSISWDALDAAHHPDLEHPVYLVVLGTSDDGALIGLNLAALSRIRLGGDRATTVALLTRWILELLATHPSVRIGCTDDAWNGPWTTRIEPVTPGRVPAVDVLVCGPALTYADRAQIIAAATSPIILDLGDDAALTSTWEITCGADRQGHIRRGRSATPMAVTVFVPATEVVERCAQLLLTDPRAAADAPMTGRGDTEPSVTGEAIDFFDEPAAASAAAPESDERHSPTTEPVSIGTDGASVAHAEPLSVERRAATCPPADMAAAAAAPVLAPIWNRLLGRAALDPPHPGDEPGARERRLHELTVFLQLHPWATTDDIIGHIFRGAASEKTVTQQISLLRKRLGTVRPGGPKALPPMQEGHYHLDNTVRSDWMEFERLVEILIETTPTAHLTAAMNLVTGPPLGGIPAKEWPCARDLRDQLRDRIPGAAVALARRHHHDNQFALATEIARKGLWYDCDRQDLWQIALQSALDDRNKDAFRALRSQYLTTIASPEREPAVFDLTRRAG